MGKSEKEIQKYIWEHRDEFSDMMVIGPKTSFPEKLPWEYEPWELIYQQIISEYFQSVEYLKGLNLFGCEITMPKDGESDMRSDLLGCLEGENGFVICELKVSKQTERQAFTELLAYGNYVRGVIAPMGRQDIFYLLVAPMEERIVREATICNMLYERNRIVALIPEWDDDADTLKLKLWVPSPNEFRIISKTAFAFQNIDTFKVTWRSPGKWSPAEKGANPNNRMTHQLNQVSAYAAQLMEAKGINGFAYCSQLYPEWRDNGYIENGLVICGINPYKSAKTKLLYEHGASLKEASESGIGPLSIFNLFPYLKKQSAVANEEFNYWEWMSDNWRSALEKVAFDVRDRVTISYSSTPELTDHNGFTWDQFLNNSIEDFDCWNYDLHLTGVLREFYDLKLEKHYKAFKKYSPKLRSEIAENHLLEPYYIDMINSNEHIRDFLKSITDGSEDDVIDTPLDGELELFERYEDYFESIFPNVEEENT